MNSSIKRRVERLSARSDEWSDVLALIREKKRYKALTETQRERYCLYYFDAPCSVVEGIYLMLDCPENLESYEDEMSWIEENRKHLDFVLKKRPLKMSLTEEREHIEKVADEIEKMITIGE